MLLDESTTVVAVPDRLEQHWLHPTNTDWYYLIAGLSLTAMAIVLYGEWGLIGLLIFTLGYVQGKNGRLYYLLLVVRPRCFWIDKFQKGVLWEAEPAHPRKARLLRPPTPNKWVSIQWLPIVKDGKKTTLALLYHRLDKTDTLIIGGEGSDIAGMNILEQGDICDRFANSMKRLSGVKGLDIMVSLFNSRRPFNAREMLEVYSENYHPDFLPGEQHSNGHVATVSLGKYEEDVAVRQGDANIAQVVEQGLFMGRDFANKNTMAMAITIRREDVLHKLAKKGSSMADEASERFVVKEIAQLAEELLTNCGVANAHAYSLEEMHEHMRYVWDVQQDDVYASWQSENQGDLDDPMFDDFHWPQDHIHAKKEHCVMDDNYHAVLRVVESSQWAEPDTFRPIFFLNVPNVTVAVVGKTVKAKREVWGLEAGSSFLDAGKEALGVVSDTQAALERSDRMQSRLESVYHAKYSQHYNIVVVVSAPTGELLEHYVDIARREVNAIEGLYAEPVSGSFLQLPWVYSAHGCPM